MRIYDRIYSEITINKEEEGLFNFPEFQRLRHLSQTNSSFFTPTSNTPTRMEHCLGVYHLAKEISKKKEFRKYEKELKFAGFLHDFGHPPFSHISEHILKEIKHKDHEEFTEELMETSGIDKYLSSIGVDYKFVTDLITGKSEPLGSLFNGSIDLDNIDNIIRWATAVGFNDLDYYDPLQLARSFHLEGNKLYLDNNSVTEVEKWLQARTKLYNFIDDSELIIIGNMLRKALNYAYLKGDVKDDYFLMTDYEAKEFLIKSNEKSAKIIDRLEKFDAFERIYNKSLNVERSLNWKERFDLERKIASEFCINEEDIIIYVGKLNAARKIHLPFLGEREVSLTNEKGDEWRVIIAIAKELLENDSTQKEKLKERLEEELKLNEYVL